MRTVEPRESVSENCGWMSEKSDVDHERATVYAFLLKLATVIFLLLAVKKGRLACGLGTIKNSCVSFDFGLECRLLAV